MINTGFHITKNGIYKWYKGNSRANATISDAGKPEHCNQPITHHTHNTPRNLLALHHIRQKLRQEGLIQTKSPQLQYKTSRAV